MFGFITLVFLLVIFVCLVYTYYGPNIIEMFTENKPTKSKYNKNMIVTRERKFVSENGRDNIRINIGTQKGLDLSVEIRSVVVEGGKVGIEYTLNDCNENKNPVLNPAETVEERKPIHKLSLDGDAFVSLVESDELPLLCAPKDMSARLYVLKTHPEKKVLDTSSVEMVKTIKFAIRANDKVNLTKGGENINAGNLKKVRQYLKKEGVAQTDPPKDETAQPNAAKGVVAQPNAAKGVVAKPVQKRKV